MMAASAAANGFKLNVLGEGREKLVRKKKRGKVGSPRLKKKNHKVLQAASHLALFALSKLRPVEYAKTKKLHTLRKSKMHISKLHIPKLPILRVRRGRRAAGRLLTGHTYSMCTAICVSSSAHTTAQYVHAACKERGPAGKRQVAPLLKKKNLIQKTKLHTACWESAARNASRASIFKRMRFSRASIFCVFQEQAFFRAGRVRQRASIKSKHFLSACVFKCMRFIPLICTDALVCGFRLFALREREREERERERKRERERERDGRREGERESESR
jgi:hypothetical protein